MIYETLVQRDNVRITIYKWTKESFAERTGNKCIKFKKNHYTNEIQ